MTVPRAAGRRAPWQAMPQDIRMWVVNTLGAGIDTAADQVGGMSPGCATRLTLKDGRRYFVKAVGTPLNPDTPRLFRRELTALEQLGEHRLWAALVAAWDDGDWVAMILEDIEGRHPDLWDDTEMAATLTATDELVAVLADRVSAPRAEPPEADGFVDLRITFERWAHALEQAPAISPALLPPWVRSDAHGWAGRVRRLAEAGAGARQLVHFDLRNDNLIRRADGTIAFVDWGAASVGAAWMDPLLARLERVTEPWFDESVADHPGLRDAGDDAVTTFLVGLGGFLAWRFETAVDVNLPTLAQFRRTESHRLLTGAARRLGESPPPADPASAEAR